MNGGNHNFEWISFIVAGLTALVYGIKAWDDLSRPEIPKDGEKPKPPKTKASIIRNSLYAAFGSGLVCLLVCDGLIYLAGLPFSLALLIGAMCGFMGADMFKDFILEFIMTKFKIGGRHND